MLDQFCMVSGIHPNLSKNEMTGNGFLKNAKVALCGLKNLHLTKESIKIFRYTYILK